MQQLYHDGMAIVRKVGKADLFVTFTANTNWPEVRDALRGKACTVPFVVPPGDVPKTAKDCHLPAKDQPLCLWRVGVTWCDGGVAWSLGAFPTPSPKVCAPPTPLTQESKPGTVRR
jgi:hypothetical protein